MKEETRSERLVRNLKEVEQPSGNRKVKLPRLQAANDIVIVRKLEKQELDPTKEKFKIIVPAELTRKRRDYLRGRVVSVGDGSLLPSNLGAKPTPVKVGEIVVFYEGIEEKMPGYPYVFIKMQNILAIETPGEFDEITLSEKEEIY